MPLCRPPKHNRVIQVCSKRSAYQKFCPPTTMGSIHFADRRRRQRRVNSSLRLAVTAFLLTTSFACGDSLPTGTTNLDSEEVDDSNTRNSRFPGEDGSRSRGTKSEGPSSSAFPLHGEEWENDVDETAKTEDEHGLRGKQTSMSHGGHIGGVWNEEQQEWQFRVSSSSVRARELVRSMWTSIGGDIPSDFHHLVKGNIDHEQRKTPNNGVDQRGAAHAEDSIDVNHAADSQPYWNSLLQTFSEEETNTKVDVDVEPFGGEEKSRVDNEPVRLLQSVESAMTSNQAPSANPSAHPTEKPSSSVAPSAQPSSPPSSSTPTVSSMPSASKVPSAMPSDEPSATPSSHCPPPGLETVENFNLDTFISARWYVHEQTVTQRTPLENFYCSYVELTLKAFGPMRWPFGYTMDVTNYARDAAGNEFVSDTDGTPLCAARQEQYEYGSDGAAVLQVGGPTDGSKLVVAPCVLPQRDASPYWVLLHDEEAGIAVVSGGPPDVDGVDGTCKTEDMFRDAGLWIFLRTEKRDVGKIDGARDFLAALNFDLTVLNSVDHTGCGGGDDDIDADEVDQCRDGTDELTLPWATYTCATLPSFGCYYWSTKCRKTCNLCY